MDADLDCDMCGQYLDLKNRYTITVVHEGMREEFDFCSMVCLHRWTKRQIEDQRKAQVEKLEASLGVEEPADEDQDLEEEIAEHYEEQLTEPSASAQSSSYGEDTEEYGEGEYGEPTLQPAPTYSEPPIDPTPVTRQIEDLDPYDKTKRERAEREKREQELLQKEYEENK